MEKTFTLTEAELVRAHRAYLRRSFLSLRTLVLLTMALAIGAFQAQVFGGASWALGTFGALWAAAILFMAGVYVFLPSRLFRTRVEYALEQRLRFDRGGVTWKRGGSPETRDVAEATAGGGEVYLPWQEIHDLSERGGFFFVERKHHVPIVLPFRVFASEEERDSFRQLCAKAYFEE